MINRFEGTKIRFFFQFGKRVFSILGPVGYAIALMADNYLQKITGLQFAFHSNRNSPKNSGR